MTDPSGPDEPEAPPEERRSERPHPRCPNCGARMQPGVAEIGTRLLGRIFAGLGQYSLFFRPRSGKRRVILDSGQERRALRCPICGGLWIR